MSKSTYSKAFNNQMSEFLEDMIRIFPSNVDIVKTKNYLAAMRKMNPSMVIQLWKPFVYDIYHSEIDAGNILFFIEKDYSQDVSKMESSDKIVDAIDSIRSFVRDMGHDDRTTSMQYIQNLSALSNMYADA
mgnify:CR=1 FL=1|jgi:hypothetical protein|uniref:Uncharacterized protein n=1 Tax=viral metagenome TaxID=1070528 RepID=A0A6C0JFZ7_9ZZZZ